MITASSNPFASSMLSSAGNLLSVPLPAAKRTRQAPRSAPLQPTASLWRHTKNQCDDDDRHRRAVRGIFGVFAALGGASVAYAAWQTHALLAGNHLEAAVSALLR